MNVRALIQQGTAERAILKRSPKLLAYWAFGLVGSRKIDEAFVGAAYRAILGRRADPQGLRYQLGGLRRGTETRVGMLRAMVGSIEFREARGLLVHAVEAVHNSRMELIQRYVPAADVIVDVGGASRDHPEGALLAMGYTHVPREVVIVDLPPEDRMPQDGRITSTWSDPSEELTTPDGTRVRYLYGSMGDLSLISDDSVDLVFSGESIEHVPEEEAVRVCHEAFRVLRPGGWFCLDTPNAVLTRIQSPDELIHPEHKKEYRVEEIEEMVRAAGLEVADRKGVCPMPASLRTGRFDEAEMVSGRGVSDDPEEGYLFFVKARKPSG